MLDIVDWIFICIYLRHSNVLWVLVESLFVKKVVVWTCIIENFLLPVLVLLDMLIALEVVWKLNLDVWKCQVKNILSIFLWMDIFWVAVWFKGVHVLCLWLIFINILTILPSTINYNSPIDCKDEKIFDVCNFT